MSNPMNICNLRYAMLLSAGSISLLGGCQQFKTAPPAALNESPMVVDQAMQIREWDRSAAIYTNQSFAAGSPGYWFEMKYDNPYWSYALLETPLFFGQSIILPVTMWFPPPWQPVDYAGLKIDPTYHAMPPLPPPVSGEPASMEPAVAEPVESPAAAMDR
jgi:hypothetical protein